MKKLNIAAIALVITGFLSPVGNLEAAHAAAGDTDTAMVFDGTSQYIQGTSFTGITGNFTLEAWVKQSATCNTGNAQIIYSQLPYQLLCRSNTWIEAMQDASSNWYENTYGTPILNQWVHLAYTRASGSAPLLYMNGVLIKTGSQPTATYSGTGAPIVGASGAANGFFPGQIDEIKVWNIVRSASDIATDMNTYNPNTSGLVAYYDFNDVGSSVLNRVSGANSGTNLTTFVGSPTTLDVSTTDTTSITGSTIVTFPRSYLSANGGFKVPANVPNLDVLIVAGGGAGGVGNSSGYEAGGGGAGGFIENLGVSVTPATNYPIIVGQGGMAVASPTNGLNSSAFSYTAVGGGVGGTNRQSGAVGGSGGGAAQTSTGGLGTSGQGFAGAVGGAGIGGGGGGAGGAAIGINGGVAKQSSINSNYYAGGGASLNTVASPFTIGTPGTGGGYPVSTTNATATSAQSASANTGSGGGGGLSSSGFLNNGAGGSGIVVLRYQTDFGTSITISVNPKKTTKSSASTPIVATTTSIGYVTFFANGRVINGCFKVPVSVTTATCNWRPMTQGSVTLTAQYIGMGGASARTVLSAAYQTVVGKRTTSR